MQGILFEELYGNEKTLKILKIFLCLLSLYMCYIYIYKTRGNGARIGQATLLMILAVLKRDC